MNDQVRPSYYGDSNAIQHWDLFGSQYLIGNATRYLTRCGANSKHPDIRLDLRKSLTYIDKLLQTNGEARGCPWPEPACLLFDRITTDYAKAVTSYVIRLNLPPLLTHALVHLLMASGSKDLKIAKEAITQHLNELECSPTASYVNQD